MKAICSIIVMLTFVFLTSVPTRASSQGGATTYMYTVDRSGFSGDLTINQHNASQLDVRWAINPSPAEFQRFDSIFSQPIAAQGRIYFGSWDGYEYALNRS